MEENAASARSRRRKAAIVVSDDDAPEASSSTTKSHSRVKRERRSSINRDAVTPPLSDEARRKVRTRRSPGKDASPSTKQNASSKASTTQTQEHTPPPPAASNSIDHDSNDSDSNVIEVTKPTRRKAQAAASSTKNSETKRSGKSSSAASTATKQSMDLARQLFDDDDEGDQGDKDTKKETTSAAVASTGKRSDAGNSHEGDASKDASKSTASSRKRSRADSSSSSKSNHPTTEGARSNAADTVSLQLRIRQLEMQLAETKTQMEQGAGVISQQHTILKELHGQCICHICIEPSFRPCVLAPCGHVFCIHCLRAWFTKPLESEAAPPTGWSQTQIDAFLRARTLKRRKICPSCRTELACPPVEVFLVRDMLEKVDEGLKLSKEAPLDSDMAESSSAILSADDKVRLKGEDLPKGAKLWADIFSEDGPRRIIYDEVDGVPRCGSCGCEIYDGRCSNPSCEIDYDSLSDYDDFRLPHDDMYEGMDSEDDDGYGDGGGARRNDALGRRLAEFEARHGGTEDVDGDAVRRRSEGEDDEHTIMDGVHRRDSSWDDDDDEEMDDFIVRDADESDYGGYEDEDEEDFGPANDYFHPDYDQFGSGGRNEYHSGSEDAEEWEEAEEEDDDFLPGPRRGGQASAIEISDDEGDEDDSGRETGSEVEYAGRGAGGRGRVVKDDDEGSDSDEEMKAREMGSSGDSALRRRRARIIDDEEDEEAESDDDD
ncbi:uncharacterized protein PAN0_055c6474 [Moesziomyces antarcticus]|uniref:RING-type domain-containing protein n=1 Tax=Pseudozyma antarctica TaxID=84753 RepID=A0A081CNI9_PSEA2|nr:uncharacterized protein PAN0_055c6474 [Moesziomyces antarcticus]GAK68235.1 conserved hypothetical protein [Moesziomyces antarcticus]